MGEPDRVLALATEAMRGGNLADKVIFTLAKAAGNLKLEKQDHEVLRQAVQFLKEVKSGYDWIDEPTISPESKTYAFSFKTAASSWWQMVSSPLQFVEDINVMIKTTEDLSEDKPPNRDSLRKTRLFFDRVFRHSIDRFSTLTARPEVPELRDAEY